MTQGALDRKIMGNDIGLILTVMAFPAASDRSKLNS
jgi:hypothetical protein